MLFLILLSVVSLLFFWQNNRQKNNIKQIFNDQAEQSSKQQQVIESVLRETLLTQFSQLQESLNEKLRIFSQSYTQQIAELKAQLQQAFTNYREQFDKRQMDTLKILQDTLQGGMQENRFVIKDALHDHAKTVSLHVDQLTKTTESNLKDINQQVEKRLSDGFTKTNETFQDVVKRLTLIDVAQQKISELSQNMISLQDILNDKRSRGAFGEVQLSALIHNVLPEQHFSLHSVLSNNRRPDCLLFLPPPTGNIAIDAKFPLENFRLFINAETPLSDKQQALRQFKIDIRHHIQSIAEKYIIPGETASGAVMFIPAETIFAEIHANHPDLVEYANQLNVWIVSPTTMVAILTTARAVLKDAATRQQVHEIQSHLRMLAEDFERFQIRMDNLAKRIAQTHHDVEQVHVSSKKISQRFIQIERAELDPATLATPIVPLETDKATAVNTTESPAC